jgi:hypothetical protein
MQVFPAAMMLVGTLMPAFLAFALGPTLIAALIVRMLGVRSAVGLMVIGAMTGLAGLILFQLIDVTVLHAPKPVLSLQDGAVPALLAGACGGLCAWWAAFGARAH